ncbi:ankyrin repeat domain-containing protein [Thalassotalea sp. G20_0]|nr:ankyrin repeat domain-containing protein [Thalassotalea sp. G20_0]
MNSSAAQSELCQYLGDMISEERAYEDECPICAEPYYGRQVSPVIVTECKHRYHLDCFAKAMRAIPITSRSSCPNCRQFPLPVVRESGALLHEDSPYCADLPFEACRTGDVETLQELLTQDKTIAQKKYSSEILGMTYYLLHIAAKKGHLACVQTLINAGADVNAALPNGATPLYLAAQENKNNILQALLNEGADPNFSPISDGSTPLHAAVWKNNIACLQTLLNSGANINAAKTSGATSLHMAAYNNSVDSLETLLNGGANIKATMTPGLTPLKIAVLLNNEPCQQALITAKEKLKAAQKKDGEYFNITKKLR